MYYQSKCNDLPFLGFIHLKVNAFIDKLKIPFNPFMHLVKWNMWTPQDFYSMFGHFTTLCMKELTLFVASLVRLKRYKFQVKGEFTHSWFTQSFWRKSTKLSDKASGQIVAFFKSTSLQGKYFLKHFSVDACS